tara:strand:+ start:638 stop:916 length:279 start_codon:yes stop_codon:yes gene_type:complete
MANYISSNTGAVIDAAVDKVENSSVSQADLTKLAAVTSTASEINITDGLTATTAELNQLDDKTVGGTNSDDIVDVASSQSLDNKTLEGGTYT